MEQCSSVKSFISGTSCLPPSLKCFTELNEEAKSLLGQALMEANLKREKNILKRTTYSLRSPSLSDSRFDNSVSERSDALSTLEGYSGYGAEQCGKICLFFLIVNSRNFEAEAEAEAQ